MSGHRTPSVHRQAQLFGGYYGSRRISEKAARERGVVGHEDICIRCVAKTLRRLLHSASGHSTAESRHHVASP